MTAVDHLIAALVELEQQSIEIEHRQSFIRVAIEAFGIDADDALLVAMRREADDPLVDAKWSSSVPLGPPALSAEQGGVDLAPETVRQDCPRSIDDLYGGDDFAHLAVHPEGHRGHSERLVIPAPVFACSVHMLGAWVIVTEAGAIACPTRAVAERVRYLIGEHGMADGDLPTCPDSVGGMPW